MPRAPSYPSCLPVERDRAVQDMPWKSIDSMLASDLLLRHNSIQASIGWPGGASMPDQAFISIPLDVPDVRVLQTEIT